METKVSYTLAVEWVDLAQRQAERAYKSKLKELYLRHMSKVEIRYEELQEPSLLSLWGLLSKPLRTTKLHIWEEALNLTQQEFENTGPEGIELKGELKTSEVEEWIKFKHWYKKDWWQLRDRALFLNDQLIKKNRETDLISFSHEDFKLIRKYK